MSENLLARIGIDDSVGSGAVQGEVVEFNGQSLVIDGNFTPGDALTLRPGVRVVVLTESPLEEVCSRTEDVVQEAVNRIRRALDRVDRAVEDALGDI